MAYISKITDLSGTTYDIKDAAVPAWAKAANPPSYALAYDESSSVGLAEVGDAVTGEPNYTPSGDVHQTIEELKLMTGGTAELTASFSNGTLTLGVSLTPTTATKNVATSAPVFVGNGVHFVITEGGPTSPIVGIGQADYMQI